MLDLCIKCIIQQCALKILKNSNINIINYLSKFSLIYRDFYEIMYLL